MVLIESVKTLKSEGAVNRIKAATKKCVYNCAAPAVSAELKLKKQYMQSDEFIKDTHNQEMFSLIDSMMAIRDKIAESIKQINASSPKDELAQGTNGFARIKKYLEQNTKLNSAEYAGMTSYDNAYKLARTKVHNKSREVLKNYGR